MDIRMSKLDIRVSRLDIRVSVPTILVLILDITAQNPGELKSIKLGLSAITDLNFYRWSAWFWFNSLLPGRAEYNHESCRQLAWLRWAQIDTVLKY